MLRPPPPPVRLRARGEAGLRCCGRFAGRLSHVMHAEPMSDPVTYRDRDLYLFVTSRFIATLAIQVQSVAIGWQIYDMERTPLALGLVGLCQFLPMFLLTLPAGDITDRFNQRRVYSLAAGLQAICSALFLGLSIFHPHTAWMYFVVLVLFGAARGFAGPSGSSLLPFLVPPERISKAMAI